jgi:hypothetical protein
MVPNRIKVPVHRMGDGRRAMRWVVVIGYAKTTWTDAIIIATAVPPAVINADLMGMLKVQIARSAVETPAVRNGPRAISPSAIHGRI